MRLYVHDPRQRWGRALSAAARKRGWSLGDPRNIDAPGYGFVRPHANPAALVADRALARRMPATMITDLTQIEVYDDKRAQHRLWSKWMPETWVFETQEEALAFLGEAEFPLMSKADVGASSYNVRYLKSRSEAEAHVRKLFSDGIMVEHCSGDGARSLQKGYVYLQRFIPHDVTYRVNAIGRQRAVFFRSCYPDRPMAQTGNVRPAYGPEDVPDGLLDFANAFLAEAGTQWCALDILKDGDGWKLLETSLAWPHPAFGDCNNARMIPSGRKWADMWDVLLDEVEAGAFGPC